jgi:extracellular elastinolytic metalloproteinase
MNVSKMRRRGFRAALVPAAVATLALSALASAGASGAPGGQEPDPGFQGENAQHRDFDSRAGRQAPTAAQSALVAKEAVVRWNDFGTPHSLVKHGGYLAGGLGRDELRAARDWIAANRGLFGLSAGAVSRLELVNSASIGSGRAVLLRQRFGGLQARLGGLLVIGVVDGKVAYVSSSLTGDEALASSPTLSAKDAYVRAAGNVGRTVAASDISKVRRDGDWTVMDVAGFAEPQRARPVAVPTPTNGVRAAWETLVLDSQDAFGFSHFVDARTGEVLARVSIVDYLAANPTWSVFPNTPRLDYSSADTRELWCWLAAAGCERVLDNPAATLQWDIDPNKNESTLTTKGNAARSTENWFTNNPFKEGHNLATPSPTRDYVYGWTNQWFEESCNPDTTFTSTQRNDIDAAAANLFAMHNRMHDWSYHLGFTEPNFNLQERNFDRGGKEHDPEHGNVQAGGV